MDLVIILLTHVTLTEKKDLLLEMDLLTFSISVIYEASSKSGKKFDKVWSKIYVLFWEKI